MIERVKRPIYFPALVAINNTPVIWDKNKKRYTVSNVLACVNQVSKLLKKANTDK